mmetsp:Transcript_113081/g.365242  ORF Transcript_113081/g.365242 Transcript_113081/m.365242 type:complete len:242 (+) Transcript_113081:1092-1817(+)
MTCSPSCAAAAWASATSDTPWATGTMVPAAASGPGVLTRRRCVRTPALPLRLTYARLVAAASSDAKGLFRSATLPRRSKKTFLYVPRTPTESTPSEASFCRILGHSMSTCLRSHSSRSCARASNVTTSTGTADRPGYCEWYRRYTRKTTPARLSSLAVASSSAQQMPAMYWKRSRASSDSMLSTTEEKPPSRKRSRSRGKAPARGRATVTPVRAGPSDGAPVASRASKSSRMAARSAETAW